MKIEKIKEIIENIDIDKISKEETNTIKEDIKILDTGLIRVAEQKNEEWVVNEWVKNAILQYFVIKKLKKIESGEIQYFDKFEPKKNYGELNIRVVPPGAVRYGAFCGDLVRVRMRFLSIIKFSHGPRTFKKELSVAPYGFCCSGLWTPPTIS